MKVNRETVIEQFREEIRKSPPVVRKYERTFLRFDAAILDIGCSFCHEAVEGLHVI